MKATADSRTTAATPSAAATVQISRPVLTPSEVPSAARRPWISAFLVTRTVSGPGATITSAAIPTKAHRWTPTAAIVAHGAQPGYP